jgi:RNA polymerase sigma-70 factor (ECF subfamily)
MRSDDRVWRERTLRSAALAGDERAWQTWYDESFEGLYAYVWWRCAGLRDLADEVVQETWLTAVRRVRAFDPERGPFAGWLCGIAANVLRNQLRREGRRRVSPCPAEARATEPADAGLEQREQAERIARALAELPERYEAVLRAKYLDGRSMAEIAAAWGETPKAVESLLTRARDAFREAYLRRESNDERHP